MAEEGPAARGLQSKKSKKEKKAHKHKSRKEAEEAAAATATGEDQALRRPAANASMGATLKDKEKWKAQVLEAAAKAQATLASGDLQSQMSEMVGKHNNFGGDAVDWRAKAKLKKQMQVRPACSSGLIMSASVVWRVRLS